MQAVQFRSAYNAGFQPQVAPTKSFQPYAVGVGHDEFRPQFSGISQVSKQLLVTAAAAGLLGGATFGVAVPSALGDRSQAAAVNQFKQDLLRTLQEPEPDADKQLAKFVSAMFWAERLPNSKDVQLEIIQMGFENSAERKKYAQTVKELKSKADTLFANGKDPSIEELSAFWQQAFQELGLSDPALLEETKRVFVEAKRQASPILISSDGLGWGALGGVAVLALIAAVNRLRRR
ncbi:MAG TPA: hypothetical protein V6C99_02405 [Oculatellaceae cyanobacterium]|jgi:hypothetical protein